MEHFLQETLFASDAVIDSVRFLFIEEKDLKEMFEKCPICVICQQEFKVDELVTSLMCGHVFHTKCQIKIPNCKMENGVEHVMCPLDREYHPTDCSFPFRESMSKGKVAEDDDESPHPQLATVCICGEGFKPSERVCYIRQCRCFYHRACFRAAFETQRGSTSYGNCVRCFQLFNWHDVRKVDICDYNDIEGICIVAIAMATGFIAYPIAQTSSEEDEDDSEEEENEE